MLCGKRTKIQKKKQKSAEKYKNTLEQDYIYLLTYLLNYHFDDVKAGFDHIVVSVQVKNFIKKYEYHYTTLWSDKCYRVQK